MSASRSSSTGGPHSAFGPGPGPAAELETGALSARAGLRGANSGSRPGQRARRPGAERGAGRAPTCSTPASCSPTRTRCSRFDEHEVVLPVVVITELEAKRHHPELGYFARAALRLLDELRVQHGRLDEPVADRRRRRHRCASSSTTPTRRRCRPGFRLGDNDTRILAVARNLADEGALRHAGLQGPAAAGQGLGGRAGRRGVPRRARRRVRLDRHGRARRRRRRPRRRCTTTARLDLEEAARAALPHRAGAALRAGQRAGPGHAGQAGAAGPRRPRRVRPARPSARAAGRARPAARPRGRHRLARRPRRHRQVRAGAVRRARGGDGAAAAQEGRRVPAAVRRRRPGARLPARASSPRRCSPGRRRSSTPSAR